MDSTTIIVIVLVQAVVCACLSSKVVSEKGYSGGDWATWGFLFGIFALIGAAGLPLKRSVAKQEEAFPRKVCPACAEPVRFEARKCRHCGESLSEEQILMLLVGLIDKGGVKADRATKFLVEIAPKGAVEQLIHLIRQRSMGQRYAAIALGELGDAAAIPILARMLRREHFDLAKAAAAALGRIGVQALPDLQDAISDAPKDLQKQIKKLVRDIEGRTGPGSGAKD